MWCNIRGKRQWKKKKKRWTRSTSTIASNFSKTKNSAISARKGSLGSKEQGERWFLIVSCASTYYYKTHLNSVNIYYETHLDEQEIYNFDEQANAFERIWRIKKVLKTSVWRRVICCLENDFCKKCRLFRSLALCNLIYNGGS